MKTLLRIIGTWMLGLAIVLIVVDGTRSLAADHVTLTPLSEIWAGIDKTSWAFCQNVIAEHLAPWGGDIVTNVILGWPGWVIAGVLGLVCLVVGRKHRRNTYVTAA